MLSPSLLRESIVMFMPQLLELHQQHAHQQYVGKNSTMQSTYVIRFIEFKCQVPTSICWNVLTNGFPLFALKRTHCCVHTKVTWAASAYPNYIHQQQFQCVQLLCCLQCYMQKPKCDINYSIVMPIYYHKKGFISGHVFLLLQYTYTYVSLYTSKAVQCCFKH